MRCVRTGGITLKPTDPASGFTHEIRVGWGDCDPARIAFTGRLPVFALEAIDAWWEHHLGGDGWYQMELDRGFGTPFVSLSLDFRAPVTPRHRLVCEVWPTALGTKSITFRVAARQGGILCFEGDFTSVFAEAGTVKTRPAPPDIRALITPLLRPAG